MRLHGTGRTASLVLPAPAPLAAALRAGALDDYRFEALIAHRRVAVRLTQRAGGADHTDKRGRVWRRSYGSSAFTATSLTTSSSTMIATTIPIRLKSLTTNDRSVVAARSSVADGSPMARDAPARTGEPARADPA